MDCGVLYNAQREGRLATTGPYAYIQHPQCVGFIAIMFGFLLPWPTLITLIMFPIMTTVYVRLAHREEAEVRRNSGRLGRVAQGRRDFFPGQVDFWRVH
jgi:protein-S-isoprenylcysteine O-methyltransferase Ste14